MPDLVAVQPMGEPFPSVSCANVQPRFGAHAALTPAAAEGKQANLIGNPMCILLPKTGIYSYQSRSLHLQILAEGAV